MKTGSDIMCINIEVLEDHLEEHYPGILDVLLIDQTKKQHPGKYAVPQIIWASDSYAEYGEDFSFDKPIQKHLVTKQNGHVIRPRASKSKEEQQRRTRNKAEVFTPSWICNAQNNLIDNDWFGKGLENQFNIENSDKTWTTNRNNIQFPKGKTWKDYVSDARLEITCGEAPYLTSRYDSVSGIYIPTGNRIGLLDRKLRVVSENTETAADWLKWAEIALMSCYGFEFQGDSLLIARESAFFTFTDFYKEKFGTGMPSRNLEEAANIISWNLWQMDGFKSTVPGIRQAVSLKKSLGEGAIGQPEMPCLISDWAKPGEKLLTPDKMRFTAIVGNPPYQFNDGGAGASAVPIYNRFVDMARQLDPHYISIIMPSRWMTGGRGLDNFRNSMLDDKHMQTLYDYYDARECFCNVEIKAGVCYFLWNKAHDAKCEVHTFNCNVESVSSRYLHDKDDDIFIRDYRLIELKNAIQSLGETTFDTMVSSMKPYGIRGDFFKSPAKYGLPDVKESKGNCPYSIIGLDKGIRRITKYMPADYPIPKTDMLNDYKIFVTRNYGIGTMGELPASPIIAKPGMLCTETFVQIGPFSSKALAENCLSYMRTKIFRVMVGLRKNDQGAGKDVYAFVPIPKEGFDEVWNDERLYKKYNIEKELIEYIDTLFNQ